MTAPERTFPVHSDSRKLSTLHAIPWAVIAPHEAQAEANHGQTLERLASRGGLSFCEMAAVLGGRRWQSMDPAEAEKAVRRAIEAATQYVGLPTADALLLLRDRYIRKPECRDLLTRAAEELRSAAALVNVPPEGQSRAISVNGDGKLLTRASLTYDDIVALADERGTPTVTYSRGVLTKPHGLMHPGCDPVPVQPGMRFSVMHTGNA